MRQEKFVLLDRDGVINQDSPDFIKTPEEWLPLPGSVEAITLLSRHKFKVIVITNQSGLARGLFDAATLEAIHAKMAATVKAQGGRIERIYICPHGPSDNCTCRKPKPGLLRQFAQDYRIDLHGLPFVGDAPRDIDAALAVGATPILVKTGKGRQTLADNPNLSIPVFENLYAVAEYLVANQNP